MTPNFVVLEKCFIVFSFIALVKENVYEIVLTQCSDNCIILSCDRSIAIFKDSSESAI